MEKQIKLISYEVGAIIIVVLLFIFSPLVIINAGERGVVLKFGKVDRIMDEGLSLKVPLVEKVQKFDVKTLKEEIDATAASKDLQNVTAKVALNYNLIPEKVGVLFTQIGKHYKIRVIDPAIQEAVKAATAKYTAEELVTKRQVVRDEIKTSLKIRLANEYINVTEVSIVDFQFSNSFDQAIEAKVTAEQKALEQKNKLEQVKYEAEQKIAQAQAEAQSIRLQSEAAQNQKYIELRQLEVQLEFAKKWNGVLPVNLYGSAPIPFLQLNSK